MEPKEYIEKHFKDVKKSLKKPLEQILIAYSDSHDDVEAKRNLGFHSNTAFNADLAVRISRDIIGGYNEFDENCIQGLIDLFGEDSNFYFARDCSVCIYVEPSKPFSLYGISYVNFRADSIYYLPGTEKIKIWWD